MATRPTGFDQTAQPAKRPAPFWHRLNTFFTFPLQSKPLMYSLILALSSMLFKVIFFPAGCPGHPDCGDRHLAGGLALRFQDHRPGLARHLQRR